MENAHAVARDVENQQAAAVAEEGRLDAGAEAGSQTHGWGTVVARFFKRLRLPLPTSETLPEERRQSLPFRPGHNIDVIKEETTLDDEDMGGDRGGPPNSDFESRLSTGTSSSSEVAHLTFFEHSALAR